MTGFVTQGHIYQNTCSSTTLSCQFVTLLCELVANSYDFIQLHLYVFVQSAYAPLLLLLATVIWKIHLIVICLIKTAIYNALCFCVGLHNLIVIILSYIILKVQ